MNYYINNNVSFKGYDAIRLRGLYMQGLAREQELGICRQMKEIAEKEHLDFFINQNNTEIKRTIESGLIPARLDYWAQDIRAFIRNGKNDIVMCNKDLDDRFIDLPSELSSYKMKRRRVLPRGGNYFIGYKPTSEKWMIINDNSVNYFYDMDIYPERISLQNIKDAYGVKEENIYITNSLSYDLDMSIRPIGYPYVLVHNEDEALKNIEKMQKKFPQSFEIYEKLIWFQKYMYPDYLYTRECDNVYNCLKEFGFIPIKIGGFYSADIDFLNSIAFKNENNKISLISNSTQYSCPELEYLEKLFEQDLREKVDNIENVYFVSGGKKTEAFFDEMPTFRKRAEARFNKYHNIIMDFLGWKFGGIHCMTAEIPDFDKLV